MTNKSDYFLLNVKKLYPSFPRPTEIETEIWAELLEQYSLEDIRTAIKSYRKNTDGFYAPTPSQFNKCLQDLPTSSCSKPKKFDLPLSPETYLMEQDKKAGRCLYFFSTYSNAVKYVLEVKLKEEVSEETHQSYSRGEKYRMAVEYGLFAEFDKILEHVHKEGYC